MSTANTLLGKLPPMAGKTETIIDRQQVGDIVDGLLKMHAETKDDYDIIAPDFFTIDDYKLADRLFSFCKRTLPYRIESEQSQTVRTPAAILALRRNGSDCKHYASFIGGVLDAINRGYDAKIKWVYRFAGYDDSGEVGHVFVVMNPGADNELWIDPVLSTLDKRNPYPKYVLDKKIPFNMALKKVSGVLDKIDYKSIPGGIKSAVSGDIGSGLLAVIPELSSIPVVGWIAPIAGQIMNTLKGLFGKSSESKSVQDLVKHYRIQVLGYPLSEKGRNVTVEQADEAQAWFSIVTGVPIYDGYEMMKLIESGKAYRDYRASGDRDVANLSDDIVDQAHVIAASMDYPNMRSGQYKNMTAARTQSGKPVDPATLGGGGDINPYSGVPGTDSSGGLTTDVNVNYAGFISKNPLTIAMAIGLLGWGIYEVGKPRRRVGAVKKKDVNASLLIGAAAIAGLGVFLIKHKQGDKEVKVQDALIPGMMDSLVGVLNRRDSNIAGIAPQYIGEFEPVPVELVYS